MKFEISDPPYERPVIPVLLMLMAGLVLGFGFPGHSNRILPLSALLIIYVVVHIRRKRPAAISPLLLATAVGYLSIQPWAAPVFPENHIVQFIDKGKCRISGLVEDVSQKSAHGDRCQLVLRPRQITLKGATHRVFGKLWVTIQGHGVSPSVGDTIDFKAHVRGLRNFNNPSAFDYRRHMACKGLWARAYVRADKMHPASAPKTPSALWRSRLESVRHTIRRFIDREVPPDLRPVMAALLIGQRARIPESQQDAFRRAGVSHLLAISGLHVGIIAAAAFFLVTRLLSHFNFLLLRGWVRHVAAGICIPIVIAYGLLAGFSPSTQRAVIMVCLFLASFWVGRPHDLLNTLAVAALFILLLFPPALFSVSFQLSFAAVYFILYGLSRISHTVFAGEKRLSRFGDRVLQFLTVSLLAYLGTLPLVMHYFNQVSLVGLPVNLLAVPLIGFLVVPMGLASVFLLPLWTAGAAAVLKISAFILGIGIGVIEWAAHFPWATVNTFTPTVLEMLCYYALAWAVLWRVGATSGKQFSPKAVSRRSGAVAALALTAFVVFIGDIAYWTWQRYGGDTVRATILDVGQGSAALLELPGGYSMLVDGGGFSDNTVFDVGRYIVGPFLWRKKIMTLDTILLSHPDSDHFNGLTYIVDHFKVKTLWTTGETTKGEAFGRFRQAVTSHPIHEPPFKSLPRSVTVNGVDLALLYPPGDHFDSPVFWHNENNNSLVLKVTYDQTRLLFPGDIQSMAEAELCRLAPERLRSDVLIAPHHGSRSSSSQAFLDAVHPDIIVVSAGYHNRKWLPHPDVLERYRKLDADIYRTYAHGAVILTTNGHQLEIATVTEQDGDYAFTEASKSR